MSSALARGALDVALRRLREGTLFIIEPDGTRRSYGAGHPTATLAIRSPQAWAKLLHGSGGFADAYAAGLWDSPDLVALIRLAARNATDVDVMRRRLAPAVTPMQRMRAYLRPNTRGRQRQDIAAHYDLGNELFARMLDPTMTYSCAVFERPHASLEEAQSRKLELVCQKLDLAPDDRVLEVGGGWGSFAVHAASTRGCQVTTTTISREQHAYVTALVHRLGLSDRVTVLASDYRDLRGRYDKLVSIEMIEAVGWRNTGDFFEACASLLSPQGAMLLQAITIDDRAYETDKASRSFIKTRIFPGGSLPSVEAIARDLARRTDLQLAHLHDLTAHYVATLSRWRERFSAHAEELRALGYDEPFQRLWRFYLAYCEAGFAERRICDLQFVLAKPQCRLRWLREGADPVVRLDTDAGIRAYA